MKNRLEVTEGFFFLFGRRSAARYLEFEHFLAGGFLWWLRAYIAERRLVWNTKGHVEAAGPKFETLYKQWSDLNTLATFGKIFAEPAVEKVARLTDIGIPLPVIRNWALNGHIDQDGSIVDKDSRVKLLLTRVLGSTWHTLTAVTATLFLTYSWALQGPISRKTLASLLILVVFGLFASLMNSRSFSALPPSPEVKSRIENLLDRG